MNAITVNVGGECWIGTPNDPLNAFARGGINTTTFSGSVVLGESDVPSVFRESDVIVPATQRYGFETALGGVWNVLPKALGIEGAVHYTNLNLVGKEYTKPERFSGIANERAFNDGKNPDNPADTERTFDFLSFRLGVRMWF